MKKSKLLKLLSLFTLFIVLILSCNDDDEILDSKPLINLTELGLDNNKKANIGSDLHIEARIVAENLVDKVSVKITKKDGEAYSLEKTYDEFSGIKNPLFHKHLDIPIGAPAGEYNFKLIVTDKKGQSNEVISTLTLIDKGNNSPEPKEPEYEGVKLIVTYQDSNNIDIREPHNERNDILKSTSPNLKIAQNLRYYTSNAIVYNPTEINFIDTGLELHADHFHTGPISITSTAKGSNLSAPYWRNFNALTFDEGDGSIVYTTAENIMNGASPKTIANIVKPHQGLVTSLGGKYFAITDSDQGNTKASSIKVIQSDNNNIISQLDGFKQISSRANYRIGFVEHSVYATDKGLITFKIGNSTNFKVVNETIAYPNNFNHEPFEELFNKYDLKQTSVFGVKKNSGIYNVDLKNGSISQLLHLNNIDQVVFNFEDSFCYIITTNNKLITYETNSFSKISETEIQSQKNNGKPRLVATRKLVYLAYPGAKDILRYNAQTLEQYKSIVLNNKVSDIGLAGNLTEVVINNHNK